MSGKAGKLRTWSKVHRSQPEIAGKMAAAQKKRRRIAPLRPGRKIADRSKAHSNAADMADHSRGNMVAPRNIPPLPRRARGV